MAALSRYTTGLGKVHMAIWIYVGEGNCLALVLRSEGLMALPLITNECNTELSKKIFMLRKVKHDFLRNVIESLFCKVE